MIETIPNITKFNSHRILSIDAFRGITFFLMIIVNELHGISGISPWFKHMPADVDAMSFPDVIFPAFLFIVGMSIPFGLKTRVLRGESSAQIVQHIGARALALITMGLFMVNAESGFDQNKMLIPISIWSLLSYIGFMLLWGVYRFEQPLWNRLGKSVGIVLLLILAVSYRGDQNSTWMSIQWWGILGLIGWAYLLSSIIYLLSANRILPVLISILSCTAYYALSHSSIAAIHFALGMFLSQDAHAAHTAIALSGLVCSMIFFSNDTTDQNQKRFIEAAFFAFFLAAAAMSLRPYFPISKIYATPSWCFYSAAICVVFFAFLYYLIDLKGARSWITLFEPAAVNPLICYLIPFIVEAIYGVTGWHSPTHQWTGLLGILACIVYAALIFALVAILNRFNFKMRF